MGGQLHHLMTIREMVGEADLSGRLISGVLHVSFGITPSRDGPVGTVQFKSE